MIRHPARAARPARPFHVPRAVPVAPAPPLAARIGLVLGRAVRALTAFAFPSACVACSAVVAEGALPLCPACVAALDPADPAALAAHVAPARLDGVASAWRYDADGPLGALVQSIKYGHRPTYARRLGTALALRLDRPDADALVPIPLTRARYLERGYNQATELALGLGSGWAMPVREDLLRRGRFAGSQTRLGRAARQANVAHVFESSPDAAGQRLVLIDDVVTTGATAGAAAEALRDAGATSVALVTAAWTR